MRCRDRGRHVVGGGNCNHRRQLRGSSLRVGEVSLTNLFPNRYDNTLPANHRADTKCERNSHNHPEGDKLDSTLNTLFGVRENLLVIGGCIIIFRSLLDRACGFQNLNTKRFLLCMRQCGEALSFFENAVHFLKPLCSFFSLFVAFECWLCQHITATLDQHQRLLNLCCIKCRVDRVLTGDQSDQDQHHQTDALLAII